MVFNVVFWDAGWCFTRHVFWDCLFFFIDLVKSKTFSNRILKSLIIKLRARKVLLVALGIFLFLATF